MLKVHLESITNRQTYNVDMSLVPDTLQGFLTQSCLTGHHDVLLHATSWQYLYIDSFSIVIL